MKWINIENIMFYVFLFSLNSDLYLFSVQQLCECINWINFINILIAVITIFNNHNRGVSKVTDIVIYY